MNKMVAGSSSWHFASEARVARMKRDYEQNNYNTVTVNGLPNNDQSWISECIKWKPLQFAGYLTESWLYFATPQEAFNFSNDKWGQPFRGRTLFTIASHLETLDDFQTFLSDPQRTANKPDLKLDYNIVFSEIHFCPDCGSVAAVHNRALDR